MGGVTEGVVKGVVKEVMNWFIIEIKMGGGVNELVKRDNI